MAVIAEAVKRKTEALQAVDPVKLKEISDAIMADLTGPNGPHTIGRLNIKGVNCLGFTKGDRVLREFFDRKFAAHGDKTWVVFEKERLTFNDVRDKAAALAHQMYHEFGIRSGDRVGVAMRNMPEWCISFVAITAMGAVAVPLNSWWKGNELVYALKHSGMKLLCCDDGCLQRIVPFMSELKLQTILCRSTKPHPNHFKDVVAAGRGRSFPPTHTNTDEMALLMYTSGTTGNPKGAMLSHRGVLQQMQMAEFGLAVAERMGVPTPPDPPCVIAPVPLFHVTGCHHIFLSSLIRGAKLVLMGKWDAGVALRLIEEERPTDWTSVPVMIQDMLQHPDFAKRDTSSLLSVGGGGAPTPPSQGRETFKAFPNALPGQGYGLTETNGAFCANSRLAYQAKPESAGLPFPICELEVLGEESGKPVPLGQRGELVVKSALNMMGYWNNEEATKAAIITLNGDPGWFRTGDVVTMDEIGYVCIVDRAKDIIIRGGENIGSAEVEAAFYEHPAVKECAIFAMPHQRLGEVPTAMILLKEGETASAESLADFAKGKLAAFKVPTPQDILFTTEPLPRGGTGKIQKRDIKQQLLARRSSSKL
eukprot:NODE_952_length_1971_cov_6.617965_g902_i0.p1 GENE.NODE_952_length_1971_cov_6.617965_g902_i0~~NODE_952_length_1971_cov_6.617965_g902_i0.p1  ORF type:complete len:591 (-),score=105.14 NODE_952_length_1971_cov_6.617965_g902_i0:147-1919(-)